MGRAPCCDKANVKRGPWSPEEDVKLKDYIDKHGTGGNWIALPQKAGLRRCGKSCRLRWLNYLRLGIRHGEFSDDEDRIISTLFANIGSRWSIIAAQLPGRTDNDIKNYWNTKLKKKLLMGASSSLIMVPPLIPHNITSHHHDYDQSFHPMSTTYSPSISFLQSPSSSSLPPPPPSYLSPSPHYYNTYNHNNNSTTTITSASISKSRFTGSYYNHDVTPSIPNNISTLSSSSSSNNNQALMNDLQTKDDGFVFPMQTIPITQENDSSLLVMFGAATGDNNSYCHADHHANSCSSSDVSNGNNKDLAKHEDDQQQFIMFSNINGATGNHMNDGINNVAQEKHEITELSSNIGGDQSTLIDYYSSLEEIKQLTSSCNMSSSTCNSNITNFFVDENNSTTRNHHSDQLEKGIMYY